MDIVSKIWMSIMNPIINQTRKS